ncbi:hypothetical protein HYT60_01180 [Candidatus Woesebacteria bacterium]|nr:hypothetical protein [Candidatus Woesebacteria bacterium]
MRNKGNVLLAILLLGVFLLIGMFILGKPRGFGKLARLPGTLWESGKPRPTGETVSRGGEGPLCITGNVVEIKDAVSKNRGEIEKALDEIKKEIGFTLVTQNFLSDSTENDWKAFLDAAQAKGIKVLATFLPASPPKWTGNGFDLGVNETFLLKMQNHPALFGFFLIDEPFHKKHEWQITTKRMQQLYRQAKDIAPNVPMFVGFSREISKGETDPKFSDFRFAKGMCDYCGMSALEFRNYGDGNKFYKDMLLDNQTVSRMVVAREDPNAKIYSTVQVFGSVSGKSSYYMPSEEELQEMVDTLLSSQLQTEKELDMLVWQSWRSFDVADSGQLNLSKPQFEGHRNIAREACGT